MSERITVFDIEVLNAEPSSICSIGIVILEDLKVVKEYYSLIRPRDMRHDPYRYKVHQIMPKDLFKQPTFKQVWEEIKSYFEDQIVVSHDIQTDMACLRAALKRHHIEYPALKMSCTNVLSHLLLPQLNKYSVTDLCDYYQIPIEHAHHALYDAYACQDILKHLLAEENYTSLVKFHADHFLAFGEMKKNYYRNIVSPDLAVGMTKGRARALEKNVTFTGKLMMSKEEFMRISSMASLYVSHDVNTHTNYLVIGSIGYGHTRYSDTNKKVLKAKRLIAEGQNLHIISEKEFMQIVDQ